MYEFLRRRALALLKVPPEPHAPVGDPASLRVFCAGRNYYRLRMTGWAIAQALALGVFLFWTAILIGVENAVLEQRSGRTAPTAVDEMPAEEGASTQPANASPGESQQHKNWIERIADRIRSAAEKMSHAGQSEGRKGIAGWLTGYKQFFVELALMLPPWAFPIIWIIKVASFGLYLVQIPLTYAVRRLDFEMRWYLVTDRSLRLRHGVWNVSETTMSFANIQQVAVNQGPVQRLLGLADVKVQSAGGGGGNKEKHQHPGADMHLGLFHCVTNAAEIRDLILERLRRFRESGLGDPDERISPGAVTPGNAASDARVAARELLAEAQALHAALS